MELVGNILLKKNYYPRSYYSDKILSKYNKISVYYELVDRLNHRAKATATQPIGLLGIDTKEPYTYRNISSILGRPHCKVNNNLEGLQLKTMLYKTFIGGFKTKCEMHFCNDELFYFNYQFSNLNSQEKQNIVEALGRKYLGVNCVDIFKQNIVDSEASVISINDTITLTLDYFYKTDSYFFKMIASLREAKRNNRFEETLRRENDLMKKL